MGVSGSHPKRKAAKTRCRASKCSRLPTNAELCSQHWALVDAHGVEAIEWKMQRRTRAAALLVRDDEGRFAPRLDIEVVRQVRAAVESGGRVTDAAVAAGVSRECLSRWLREGRIGSDSVCRMLARAVDDGLATFRSRMVEAIVASPDWTSKAWVLERLWPDEFAKVTRRELTGAGGGPVVTAGRALVATVDLGRLSDERLGRVVGLLEALDRELETRDEPGEVVALPLGAGDASS